MSEQKKTLTMRLLENPADRRPGDFWVEPWNGAFDHHGQWYREASPIPEGFEVCDLADATKVLIGETWCDVERDAGGSWIMVLPNKTYHMHGFSNLGVLAIRPIPEPEPTRGEAEIETWSIDPNYGMTIFPKHLIGKTIRWEEVIKDSDGQ